MTRFTSSSEILSMPYSLTEFQASIAVCDGGPLNGDLCQREPLKRVSTNGTDARSLLIGAGKFKGLAVEKSI